MNCLFNAIARSLSIKQLSFEHIIFMWAILFLFFILFFKQNKKRSFSHFLKTIERCFVCYNNDHFKALFSNMKTKIHSSNFENISNACFFSSHHTHTITIQSRTDGCFDWSIPNDHFWWKIDLRTVSKLEINNISKINRVFTAVANHLHTVPELYKIPICS